MANAQTEPPFQSYGLEVRGVWVYIAGEPNMGIGITGVLHLVITVTEVPDQVF